MESAESPALAVDVLPFATEGTRLKLLLTRREQPPFAGRWALPGGFVGMDETAEDAAARVLYEKTGLDGLYMEQLYTFSALARDPRLRSISVTYLALGPRDRLEATVADRPLGLFEVGKDGSLELELAFDHADIIATAVQRMAGKLEYTDIGFAFLADRQRFTLTELYDIYTAVAGHPYDLPNFRRFIKKRYEETGRIAQTGEKQRGRGTPAMIYRWL